MFDCRTLRSCSEHLLLVAVAKHDDHDIPRLRAKVIISDRG
jgi:hypothetical protein